MFFHQQKTCSLWLPESCLGFPYQGIRSPENVWLEYDPAFLLGEARLFSGAFTTLWASGRVTSWWFHPHFLEFSPRTLGKMNPFWLIFFKWVGSKPPTRDINFWVFSSQNLPPAPGFDAFSARSLTTRWFLWGKKWSRSEIYWDLRPPKSNIDNKNCHVERELPFASHQSFWGPQFVSFRGCFLRI